MKTVRFISHSSNDSMSNSQFYHYRCRFFISLKFFAVACTFLLLFVQLSKRFHHWSSFSLFLFVCAEKFEIRRKRRTFINLFFPTFLPTHKVFRSFSYSLHFFLSLFLSLCVLMFYTRTLVVVQCLGGCDSLTSILFTRLVELRLWSEKTFSPTSSYKQKPREKRKKLFPTSFYCFLLSFRWKTEKNRKVSVSPVLL